MAATASPKLDLLRAKLAIAIGPIEVNLAYDEVKAAHANALDEPWSKDMSGPHKHVVFNNKSFVLSEVANEQLASGMARGCPAIDAGENIKLYLNDVWQLDIFRMMRFDMAAIRCRVTGRDPMGSLYYSLIELVNKCILKNVDANGNQISDGDATLGIEDLVIEEQGDEVKKGEGPEVEVGNGDGPKEVDGGQVGEGEKDAMKETSVEEGEQAHAHAVMEG